MRAVRCGRLLAGERLPSSRDLAREPGVSRGMVVACYEPLLAESYLVAETGWTRVADGVAESVSRSHTTSRTTEGGPSDPAAPDRTGSSRWAR
jgi:GntR family transcriptional regulator / MocR family aminotransferase